MTDRKMNTFIAVVFAIAIVCLVIAITLMNVGAADARTNHEPDLGPVATLGTVPAMTPWDYAVTVNICQVIIHPSGRTASYVDSLGRSGGPIHKPDSVTLDFPDGGWVDVTLVKDPGEDTGPTVTKRFEVEPCPPTTTEPSSSTTEPEPTTTVPPPTTTTTHGGTSTTTSGSSSTTSSTSTIPPSESTTTTVVTTSSSSSSVPVTVTTKLPSSSLPEDTTTVPSSSSSDPETTTTIPEIVTDIPELPDTGLGDWVAPLLAIVAGMFVLGGAARWGTRTR